jgi:4'-phosphopantetheinyl transferase
MHRIYYSLLSQPLTASFRQNAFALLLPGDLDKINRYKFWQDRDTTLMGKLLLRKGLLDFDRANHPLHAIKYTANNKPYLDDDIHFNVSHSGLLTVVALSDTDDIGIDVEKIEPVNPADFVYCFTESEYRQILALPDPTKTFYQLWTRKEAFLKAIGTGLSLSPAQVDARSNISWNNITWFLHQINLNDSYICHLASTNAHVDFEIIHPSPASLIL